MNAETGFATAHDSPVLFDETHRMLRDQIRRFVAAEITPHGDAWEAAGAIPRDLIRKMGDLGFLGIRYPEAMGGSEMDERATVIWAEELGRSTYSGVAISALVHTDMASIHIFNAGTEAQKEKWLRPLAQGEMLGAFALTEPHTGSDAAFKGERLLREKRHFRGQWMVYACQLLGCSA